MMNSERRRWLCLAGAGAVAAAFPKGTWAEQATAPLNLEAQPIGTGVSARLGYGPEATVPICRVTPGATIAIQLANRMSEATGLDWHGFRGAAVQNFLPDLGGAPLAPAAITTMSLTRRESGTAWFHPPFVPGWSNQTARGLAGVLIVAESAPPSVDEDIVLFIGDRSAPEPGGPAARLFVNGKVWPETRPFAPGSRLRLRLINGSTRLALAASFEGARAMVIAIDGQPSELFRPLNDILPMGPGARFDLLVDLSRTAGQEFRLGVRAADDPAGSPAAALFIVHGEGAPKPERPPIMALSPNPALPPMIPLEKAKRVDIAVQKSAKPPALYAINGVAGIALPKAPLFAVKRGATVVLGVTNRTADLIGFRPHGQAMRLLHALDDGWEPYWRDSILVPPGKNLHAAFVADTPGRWMIDSPFFDQAVGGLRHWFEVR